jgi:hypothetical protein
MVSILYSGLEILHDFAYSGKDAARGFRSRGFAVDAQKIFRSRSAHQDPADFAEIELDAVQIFAAGDRPIEELFQFAVGEMRDGFFLFGRA